MYPGAWVRHRAHMFDGEPCEWGSCVGRIESDSGNSVTVIFEGLGEKVVAKNYVETIDPIESALLELSR